MLLFTLADVKQPEIRVTPFPFTLSPLKKSKESSISEIGGQF